MKTYGWRQFAVDILFIALGFLVAIIVLRSLPCGMCEGGPL